jgi:hypothetical protein
VQHAHAERPVLARPYNCLSDTGGLREASTFHTFVAVAIGLAEEFAEDAEGSWWDCFGREEGGADSRAASTVSILIRVARDRRSSRSRCGWRGLSGRRGRGGCHDAEAGVVEDATFAGVVFAGDVDAGLFVEPTVGEPEVVGDRLGFFEDDAVGDEHGATSRVTRSAS